jgi:putative ABC transport system permease protein
MNIIQLFSLSYEALKERRLRASLTILMVIMGASLIVALNGTGNGFTNFVNSQFSSLGANVLILSPRGENIDIDLRLADEMRKIDGVDDALLYIQQISSVVTGGEEQTLIVVGVEQDKLPLLFPTIGFEVGTFVSESDSIGILFGNEAARLSERTEALVDLGQTVKIRFQNYEDQKPVIVQRSFVVRGVLSYIGSGIVPADSMVFISTNAARNLFDRSGDYDGLYVVTKDPNFNEQVLENIRNIYGNDLNIISPQLISDMIQQVMGGIYMFINIVAMVSLLVASVGIITTLQTSTMERIKEIGLLKALGFTRNLILGLFFGEATIIGIVGGGIGVSLGMVLSYGISLLLGGGFQMDAGPMAVGRGGFSLEIIPAFDPWNMLNTWILCIILSMISGFYPSWRASRLNPVVALRHE